MMRERHLEKVKSELERWNAAANAWEAKTRATRTELRGQYRRQLAALRGGRAVATERLRELREVSRAARREMSRGYDEAWLRLREAFGRARGQFERVK